MADIKRLLNKKCWTGRELGQLLLANIASDYKQALAGVYEPTPLISQAEFTKMLHSITDRVQGHIYNDYYSVYDWLKPRPAIVNGYYMNAVNDYATLRNYILQARFAEDLYKYVEQLPAIVTQKQYDELKAEKIEAYFKDGNGEELQDNIYSLIGRAISFYLKKLTEDPSKPNPLKAIRKKYKAQPLTSKIILSRYNEISGNGYYTLEDGRRSDEMTDEEWEAAITTPSVKKALNSLRIAGESGLEYPSQIAIDRITERARVYFNGGTDAEAYKAQMEADIKRGYAVPVVWHTYTEPPKDLTKWDIVEQDILLELYPADLDGSGDEYSENNFNASMEDFYTEFKDLADAMLIDMDKKYFNGDEIQAAKLPLEEWETTFISWRRLYELDFYGERKNAESDTNIFGLERGSINGIAIFRPSDLTEQSRYIDERGYYVEPDIAKAISSRSLEAFFTESEDYAEHIASIEKARSGLLSNYYYLKGYNKAIELIIASVDVPELEVFKQDLTDLELNIKALNDYVPNLYKLIRDINYGDKELQARKLEVLRDVFPPIDYESLTIPEENIEKAQELIGNFKAFNEKNMQFESLLCYRSEDEDEEGDF